MTGDRGIANVRAAVRRQYDPRVPFNRIHPGWCCALVVAALAAVIAMAVPGTASAAGTGSVAVIVVPTFDPQEYADRGAVGLLVPGAGSTVSRERALASLVSGRVVSSLVDLDGTPSLQLSTTPAETTIYVALPPPGSSHNVVRYPVAIVGPGYDGLLTSESTRIDGLVSLADIAPTAAAIAAGTTPKIRSRPDPQAVATLARLDIDLSRAHDARTGATIVLVAWLVVFSSLGILGGSALAGRAAVLVAPAALASAIVLRAVGIDDPTVVIVALAVSVGLVALLLGLRSAALLPAVVGLLSLFLLTLAVWPDVNALAAIGPHPDGGGRFFGVTNQVSTLLLAPSLAAAALAGVVGAIAIGLLLLVTVGWSRAGADGGGVLVAATAFAVLLAGNDPDAPYTGARRPRRLRRRRPRPCDRGARRASRRLEPRHRLPSVVARERCSTMSTGVSASRGQARRRESIPRSSASSRSPGSCGSVGEDEGVL